VTFDAGRLRRGELIAGGGGVLLLVAVFFLPWLARPGVLGSLDGWDALAIIRWILLLTMVLALGLVPLTATRRAPAVPVAVAMLACVTGALASLMLFYRVIHHPGLSVRPGIYVGLAAVLVIAYGGYRSLRTEGGSFGDPRAIETVVSDRSPAGASGRTDSTSAGP
jgi:hypothetical protein